ncbi:MAG TPA: NAD-dependent epimerase/dehydratase family protein, partial [Sphingopyxis sp.]
MQKFDGQLITVLGGGGFLGRYVVQRLLTRGARVRVAQRTPRA